MCVSECATNVWTNLGKHQHVRERECNDPGIHLPADEFTEKAVSLGSSRAAVTVERLLPLNF